MFTTSISQFDWRLLNQQRQRNDCVFRLFDSSKYLTTLRSNISPCQKATTLILIPLYNPLFHLWKSSKKSLGATVFLSWIPFKILKQELRDRCSWEKLVRVADFKRHPRQKHGGAQRFFRWFFCSTDPKKTVVSLPLLIDQPSIKLTDTCGN